LSQLATDGKTEQAGQISPQAGSSATAGPHRAQALQRMAKTQPGSPAGGATTRTGSPDGLKAGVEALSSLPMDHMRLHHNADRPAQLRARAFAQGHDIHLAPGQQRHLPHEAWRLVQQAGGRVKPRHGPDPAGLVSSHPIKPPDAAATSQTTHAVVQRVKDEDYFADDEREEPSLPSVFSHDDLKFSSRGHGVGPSEMPGSVYFSNGRVRLAHKGGPKISREKSGSTIERYTLGKSQEEAGLAVEAKSDLKKKYKKDGKWKKGGRTDFVNEWKSHLKDAEIGDAGSLFEVFRDHEGSVISTHPSRGSPTKEEGIQNQQHLNAITHIAGVAQAHIADAKSRREKKRLIAHYNRQIQAAYENPAHRFRAPLPL
jgi:hypothetical protein